MIKNIPKATIAVLLVLTILVSIIGTWTVLEAVSVKDKTPAEKTVSTSEGNILLNLEEPQEPVEDSANIRFEIK